VGELLLNGNEWVSSSGNVSGSVEDAPVSNLDVGRIYLD